MAEENPANTTQQEDTESETSGSGASGGSSGGGLFSPEGIFMLMIATLLDIIGFLFFILGTWFGIDDYGILDIFGFLIIGGWMFLRSGSLNSDAVKKGFRRFIEAFMVELIPFLGGIAPSWIWLVYKNLR